MNSIDFSKTCFLELVPIGLHSQKRATSSITHLSITTLLPARDDTKHNNQHQPTQLLIMNQPHPPKTTNCSSFIALLELFAMFLR